MSKNNDGGAAFPCVADTYLQEGMSLHDWFTGQALAGLASDKTQPSDVDDLVDLARSIAKETIAMRDLPGDE